MIPTRPSDVRALLAARAIRPRRSLGQNFLVDANIVRIILEAAAVRPGDLIAEVGPGLGVLTRDLLARGARVWAVEKDAALAAYLRETLGDRPGLTLHESDALETDWSAPPFNADWKAVSNLPYSVGSRILVDWAHAARPPECAVVTLQKDVVDRLLAEPGGRDYGALTIWVRRVFSVELIRKVGPGCFHPAPEVWSAVARLTRRSAPATTRPDLFVPLIRWVFSRRRKQLQTIFRAWPAEFGPPPADVPAWLSGFGLDPAARPEDVTVDQWAALAASLS